MTKHLSVLECGSCEPLKVAVHGAALVLFAVMGLYNTAAWLARRQAHLGVNAVLYTALTIWERQQVAHHVAELVRPQAPSAGDSSVLAPSASPGPPATDLIAA